MFRESTLGPSTPLLRGSNSYALIDAQEKLLQSITTYLEQASSLDEKIRLLDMLMSARHLIKQKISSGDMPSITPNPSPTLGSTRGT